MDRKKLKEISYKVFAYIIIYLCINLYMSSSTAFDFQNWYYIGNIAAASIVYLIIYLGSDSVGYRLNNDNKLKERLDRMTITKNGIIAHGVIIVVFVTIAILLERM